VCGRTVVVSSYRVNASRGLSGGQRVLPPAAVLAEASEGWRRVCLRAMATSRHHGDVDAVALTR
jgi:hypothetical protein